MKPQHQQLEIPPDDERAEPDRTVAVRGYTRRWPRDVADVDAPALNEPVAHARRTDPTTSHEAAASVTNLRHSQRAVLDAIEMFADPIGDEELVTWYGRLHRERPEQFPRQGAAGIRSRRAEIAHLLTHVGYTTTITGRRARVWQVNPK